MEWKTFWAALLGTSAPNILLGLLVLYLNRRFNRSLELLKTDLQQNIVKFTKLHDKRIEAAQTVYVAFEKYLDFLRKDLYWEDHGHSMDPLFDFQNTIQREMVFLDDQLGEKVTQYSAELFEFRNNVMLKDGIATEKTRNLLDYEIPKYLPKLRAAINQSLDPNYKETGFHASVSKLVSMS